MTSFLALARKGAFLGAMLALAACSSDVSGPTPVNDPDRITIQPETAILYSGLPTTFTVSGGTGSYAVSSSNQAVVRVDAVLNGRSFTVTPANVVVETPVTISVRDSGTAPVVSASLTVRPGTVANDIVITPTSTQGGNCSPAVCSGGDALVFATVSQGGNPLPARGVRLDVVSGDFRFITTQPGQSEVLSTSVTVVSDQAGGVHARIRALPGAANQTAVVQVTDLGTSAFRRASFTIAQATGTSPGFFTVPDTIAFTGPNTLQCASGQRADVTIFGGSPPYTIGSGGSAFGTSHNVVAASGGSFYIVANGICPTTVLIPVVDSAGRTATITVSNEFGTNAIPDLTVSPSTVTISDCGTPAFVSVAGGIPGSFTVSGGSPAIVVSPNPGTGQIAIFRARGVPATSPVTVGVASGDKVATIIVTLAGEALNTNCSASVLTVIPSSVTLTGCGFVDVQVTGGTPGYTALSNSSVVTTGASPMGANFVRISRVNPSQATTNPASVTIFDSAGARREVGVTVTGSCP